jgi:hypothetical protein
VKKPVVLLSNCRKSDAEDTASCGLTQRFAHLQIESFDTGRVIWSETPLRGGDWGLLVWEEKMMEVGKYFGDINTQDR